MAGSTPPELHDDDNDDNDDMLGIAVSSPAGPGEVVPINGFSVENRCPVRALLAVTCTKSGRTPIPPHLNPPLRVTRYRRKS